MNSRKCLYMQPKPCNAFHGLVVEISASPIFNANYVCLAVKGVFYENGEVLASSGWRKKCRDYRRTVLWCVPDGSARPKAFCDGIRQFWAWFATRHADTSVKSCLVSWIPRPESLRVWVSPSTEVSQTLCSKALSRRIGLLVNIAYVYRDMIGSVCVECAPLLWLLASVIIS
jgi:hypothetical protein